MKSHFEIRFPKKLALSVFVTLALLGAVEIGQRVSDWRKASKREVNPYSFRIVTRDGTSATDKLGGLVFELSPSLTYRPRPGQTIGPVTINRRGFRGPEIEIAKPAGVRRVALLGGSTAFGHGATAADRTVARYLERVLSAGGQRYEVLNAACTAHHSQQELIVLATEVADYAPDVVVVLDGWNDFYQSGFRPADEPLFFGLFTEIEELIARAKHPLRNALRASAFVRGLDRKRRRARPEGATFGDYVDRPDALAAYRRNLEQIVKIAHANGAKALLVAQPELFSRADPVPESDRVVRERKGVDGYAEFSRARYAGYVDAARAVAARHSAGFLDGRKVFDGAPEAVFSDWVHVTDRGNEILATAITAAIRALEQERS